MKHIQMLCLVLIVLSISLTGCMDVKDLPEEKADLVAEYAAGVLLRYSDQYERRLITKEQAEVQQEDQSASTTPEAEPTASIVPDTASPAAVDGTTGTVEPTAVPEVSLDELYHLDGIQVSYNSYEFAKRYGSTQIRAEKGETLLVVSFGLKNISGSKKKASLMDRDKIVYTLDVDGSQYSPEINMLLNGGLNYFEDTIAKGKTETAVLIFRMDQERTSASSITLTIEEESNKTSVKLK